MVDRRQRAIQAPAALSHWEYCSTLCAARANQHKHERLVQENEQLRAQVEQLTTAGAHVVQVVVVQVEQLAGAHVVQCEAQE